MNSRIVKQKLKQNYRDKPLARRCRECTHFQFVFTSVHPNGAPFCTLGEFEVNINADCDEFETKET